MRLKMEAMSTLSHIWKLIMRYFLLLANSVSSATTELQATKLAAAMINSTNSDCHLHALHTLKIGQLSHLGGEGSFLEGKNTPVTSITLVATMTLVATFRLVAIFRLKPTIYLVATIRLVATITLGATIT
jgi:hypothetical protein